MRGERRAVGVDGHVHVIKRVIVDLAVGAVRVEIRSRSPYRYLTPEEYPALHEPVMLESVTVVAFKSPPGFYGPEIFSGCTATYRGPDERVEVDGHVLPRGMPMPVSDAAARRLTRRDDMVVTPPTYRGRTGCC